MNTMFILFLDGHFEGLFTTHVKAAQSIWLKAVPQKWQMTDYSYQFGAEFFTYEDSDHNEMTFELMEVTPDERV